MSEQLPSFPFDCLPFELLAQIIYFIPVSQDLNAVCRVSKLWNEAVNDELSWKRRCKLELEDKGFPLLRIEGSTWKNLFKTATTLAWDPKQMANWEGLTLSNNNRTIAHTSEVYPMKYAAIRTIKSFSHPSVISFDIKIEGKPRGNFGFGFADDQFDCSTNAYKCPSYHKCNYFMYWTNGYCYEPQGIYAPSTLKTAYTKGDVIGVVLDWRNEEILFFKNGVQEILYSGFGGAKKLHFVANLYSKGDSVTITPASKQYTKQFSSPTFKRARTFPIPPANKALKKLSSESVVKEPKLPIQSVAASADISILPNRRDCRII